MEIRYLGHASFKIRGKKATLVTDPFEPSMVGLPWPREVKANVVTVSHEHGDHNFISGIKSQVAQEAPLIVRGPGEYEVCGVKISGFSSFHDKSRGRERGRNTIYLIKIDGVSFVHCGDLGHKLSEEQVEELEAVDILMVPVGGVYTISPAEAASVVHQLEPKIVLPMHYRREGMASAFEQLSPVSEFLEQMGKTAKPQKKLVISKEKLPEKMEVIVLSALNS